MKDIQAVGSKVCHQKNRILTGTSGPWVGRELVYLAVCIHTTNPIESLNSRVRKTVKGKSVFPTETALFKALYLAVAEAEKGWTMRTTMRTRNWQEVMAQLSIFF